mmetsp:Transcript_17299/g.35686  ORF Transcript_17299/g.35686 Transcript_17299/m.35686 type:complete len:187 (+) Transcript_17299:269-829(+)
MCLPYDDGFVIASQIMTSVALLLSWVWWISFAISIIGMTLFQLLWCCRQNRYSIYASTAVSVVSSLASFGVGIFVLVRWKNSSRCWVFVLDSWETLDETPWDWCYEKVWGTIVILCGALWLAVAGCMFYFAKSGRHATWEEHHSKTAAETNEEDSVAVEIGSVPAASAIATTIKVSDVPGKLDITD